MNIHSCHMVFAVSLYHAQELPTVSFIKRGMVGNQINRSDSLGFHIFHNHIEQMPCDTFAAVVFLCIDRSEIYFDEKTPTIFIRTHNTDLKNRLTAYSRKHPAVCKLTDVDPDTGCKEFEIEKGRFSFPLTAPYGEERRRVASGAAKNE